MWKIPESEQGKKFSEGIWEIKIEAMVSSTGQLIQIKRIVFNVSLFKEASEIEDELRKDKLIINNITFTKLNYGE